MNSTAFRYLSAPSKCLPALIALGVNAIFLWGAVRATSVLPPERVSRMSAAAVDSRDRGGRRERAAQDISFAPAGPARASCLEREESAMTVVLLGASGFVGSAILKEALDRGHLVTAVLRNQGHLNPSQQHKIQITDVYDSVALAAVIVGHDALISAINPGWKDPTLYADQVRGTTSILQAVKSAAIKACRQL